MAPPDSFHGDAHARAARPGRGLPAGLLDDLRHVEVAALGRLELVVDAGERLLDGVLGRGVEHLRLDRGVVVRPRDEDELVRGGCAQREGGVKGWAVADALWAAQALQMRYGLRKRG